MLLGTPRTPKIDRARSLSTSRTKPFLGGNLKLFCLADGDSKKQGDRYTWMKDGQKIMDDGGRIKIRKYTFLKVKSIRQSDAGLYKCMLGNSVGHDSLTFNIKVFPRCEYQFKAY